MRFFSLLFFHYVGFDDAEFCMKLIFWEEVCIIRQKHASMEVSPTNLWQYIEWTIFCHCHLSDVNMISIFPCVYLLCLGFDLRDWASLAFSNFNGQKKLLLIKSVFNNFKDK